MKWQALGSALAFSLAGALSAHACDGQTGAVIFQDNFADDLGGWDLDRGDHPKDQITPPDFVFTLSGDGFADSAQNLTFNATVGDYCMDFILPPAPAPDNRVVAGVILWATDYKNYLLVQASTNGDVELYRKSAGNWQKVFTVNSPAFNASAGRRQFAARRRRRRSKADGLSQRKNGQSGAGSSCRRDRCALAFTPSSPMRRPAKLSFASRTFGHRRRIDVYPGPDINPNARR